MWIYIGIFIFSYFAIENLKSLDCWTDSSVGETKRTTSQLQAYSRNFPIQSDGAPSLCLAARGATGEQARRKILPALFAFYYSGFLPEVVPQFLYVVRPLCLLPRIPTVRVLSSPSLLFSLFQLLCIYFSESLIQLYCYVDQNIFDLLLM